MYKRKCPRASDLVRVRCYGTFTIKKVLSIPNSDYSVLDRAGYCFRTDKVFFDWDGSPIGYVTWAYLAKDVESRLVNDNGFLLHFSEWNEGSNLWVIDLCMPTGNVKEAVRYFLEEIKVSYTGRVSWVRRRADHSVRKICGYEVGTREFVFETLSCQSLRLMGRQEVH